MTKAAGMGVVDVQACDFIGDGAAFSCTLTCDGEAIAKVEYRGDGGPYHFAWKGADGSFRRNGQMPAAVRTWADTHHYAQRPDNPLYEENINYRIACLVDAALSASSRGR